MVDSASRNVILKRRMAFLSGALAMVSGCDKNAPPPEPTGVVVGDPSAHGLPTAVPSSDDVAEPQPKLPPPPSTAIPETSCDPDREALLGYQKRFDAMYAELAKLHDSLPSSCAITDDACLPKHEAAAKRYASLEQGSQSLLGLCGCAAPIVSEYVSRHRAEATARLHQIRDRIIAAAAAKERAAERWDELVQNEATPRPCLSCIRCEPKSACD